MDNVRSIARRRLVLLGLFLAGLGLVFWLATAPTVRVGDAYREASEPGEALFDGHPIGQIIAPPLDQLVGLRLWLRRPAAPRGTLVLRVRSLDQGLDLTEIELPVAALPAQGPTSFRLPERMAAPLQMNRRETLELLLTARGVDPADPVGVAVGGNGYGYGLLVRAGREIPRADLVFETLYQARLLDRVVPITAIAYGRPGIFGAPQLYALLLYAVLVLLLGFVALVLRAAFAPERSANV
jgi:hypothetical protein